MPTWRSPAHRTTALLAVVCFTAGLLGPVLVRQHDGVADDVACNEPGLTVGHPVTQFEAVLPASLADHCAICHWWRALRHTSVASASAVSLAEPARAIARSIVAQSSSPIPHAQHGRAPPQVLS